MLSGDLTSGFGVGDGVGVSVLVGPGPGAGSAGGGGPPTGVATGRNTSTTSGFVCSDWPRSIAELSARAASIILGSSGGICAVRESAE